MTEFYIRKAELFEADELTILAKKSKAHWGYDKKLVSKWEDELTITSNFLKISKINLLKWVLPVLF